jgi:hemoglobin
MKLQKREKSMQTLYEKLGGEPSIEAVTNMLYERLLQNEHVSHFFDGIDISRQQKHLKAFLTYAFGGIPYYTGKSLRKAHESLVEEKGLSDIHFDAVLETIAGILKELGVHDDLIEEVATLTETLRIDILNK